LHYGEEVSAPMMCAIMMCSKLAYKISDYLLALNTENGTGLDVALI
jgi:hypothetical protein